MARRLTVLVPVIASVVAVALSIVLLVAGTSTSSGTQYYWISLNTSKIGQDLVQLTPIDSSSSSDPLTSILGGLDSILGGLITNITGQIDQSIEDLQGDILGNLTKALGVKDTYSLFLSKICEGEYVNADDPSSAVKYTSCTTYDDETQGLRNISNSIPSSLVIGTTNITVPLVEALGSTLNSVMDLAVSGALALFVLLIIGAVSTGIVILGSLLVLVTGHRRILSIINMAFAQLGSTVLSLFAAVTTGVITGGSSTTSGLGSAFNLQVKKGNAFIAMAWVSAVMAMVTSTYWFIVWFVDFRRTAFKRRFRSESEIGNYRGIFHEVMSDIRKPKTEAVQTKEGAVRVSGDE